MSNYLRDMRVANCEAASRKRLLEKNTDYCVSHVSFIPQVPFTRIPPVGTIYSIP
jgi:hypothetical protein